MTVQSLADLYRAYIDCLNRRDWCALGHHVDDAVERNGLPLGISGYRDMLVKSVEAIPDLVFRVDFLVCQPPRIAARLVFDCTPVGMLLGVNVDGRRVAFAENVFYEFRGAKIASVWSIIDKAAIEAQVA